MKLSNKILYAIILICLGVLFRTIWHIGPNVEFVTTATLLAGVYLGFSYALAVPMIIMAASDLIIGNTAIFIFTWSAYMVTGAASPILAKITKMREREKSSHLHRLNVKLILSASVFAIGSSVWFFLWTNFGVWLLDSFGMYKNDISGLITSYIMGIPFLKYNLAGNLILVPVVFILLESVKIIIANLKPRYKKAGKEVRI